MLLVVILIIVIIILIRNNRKLKKNLNDQININSLNQNNNQYVNQNYDMSGSVTNNNFNYEQTNTVVYNSMDEKSVVIPQDTQPKMTYEESKNNTILILGSIFILLASIIFLTTSWNLMPNVVKVLIIFFMLFVFLVASNIAENKMKLPNTANAFLYMGLFYLPLSLLGVGYFGLLGDYISSSGEGFTLYNSISSLIVSAAYYFFCKKKNKETLYYFSYGFLIFSLINIFSFFKTKLFIASIVINLLATLFIYLHKSNKYIYNEKTSKNTVASTYIIGIIFAIATHFELTVWLNLLPILLLIVNAIYYSDKKINSILLPILSTYFFLMVGLNINEGTLVYQILFMINILIIYGVDVLVNKKATKNVYLTGLILYFITLSMFTNDTSIPLFLYILYYMVVSLIPFKFSKFKKEILYILISVSHIVVMLFIKNYNLPDFINIYYAVVLYGLSFLLKDSGICKEPLEKVSLVTSVLFSLIFITDKITYIIPISIFTILQFIKNKDKSKVSSFVFSLYTIFWLVKIFDLDHNQSFTILCLIYIVESTILSILDKNNIYKVFASTCTIMLANQKIKEFEITITVVKVIPYYIYFYALFHLIPFKKKNEKDMALFEGITYSIINLAALTSSNEDCMLMIVLYILLIVFGYYKKNNTMFYVSLVFLVINFIRVTSTFWLSIPWWIYLLLMGIGLIIFAMYNEKHKK